ncbi:MAG: SDR family oxidoreductase [Candidatus Lokiarchaeota archaeon]|nr:SDR family oxidoreductase [Candidatus Lokiarchaeota archaeon]
MKALFIGGTGIISSAVSKLAIKNGVELFHLNRGKSHRKIEGVKTIIGDIRNIPETKNLLEEHEFDVVVDWIAFIKAHAKIDVKLFKNKTKQFVFISSASAYQKPIVKYPITEETPLNNPFWQYSRDKAECERYLMDQHKKIGFPATIVRPSHTYDETLIPTDWGYTVIDRMKKGKKIVIHGDGTSLWTLTHNSDFAEGFIGLLGNQDAIGEAFHITSDEVVTWNRINELMAKELGVELNCVHIPSDFIARYDKAMGPNLLGDKAYSVIFDNSKIKRFVPDFRAKIKFEDGIKEIIQFYENNPEWQIVNKEISATIDTIINAYES